MSLPALIPGESALLLDFDGTLVEIAPRPDAITVPPHLPALLDRLHDRLEGAVALVSGRSVEDLRRYLPEFPGTIIGSHGAERASRGETPEVAVGTEGLEELRAAVTDYAVTRPDLLVESKTHSVVLHFRQAPELGPEVARFMGKLADRYTDFALQEAKMAWELRPGSADKGVAVRHLMDADPFQGKFPVYAGDDTTDEAAMCVAAEFGGCGIKIGEGSSVAAHRLRDPAAFLKWLGRAV